MKIDFSTHQTTMWKIQEPPCFFSISLVTPCKIPLIFLGSSWPAISEVPVPPCVQGIDLDIDETLTDLEMFKRYCLPIHDWWGDVPWHFMTENSEFMGNLPLYLHNSKNMWKGWISKVESTVISWRKKTTAPIASQVHMRETLEYFARAKHINIPHGWDTWLRMIGWVWIHMSIHRLKKCNLIYLIWTRTYVWKHKDIHKLFHTLLMIHPRIWFFMIWTSGRLRSRTMPLDALKLRIWLKYICVCLHLG